MSADMQWFVRGLYALMKDLLVPVQSDASVSTMHRYIHRRVLVVYVYSPYTCHLTIFIVIT